MADDEPERIFQQAVGFHQAQKILMESSPNDQREALVPPVCVLAAFTSELMLKCLIGIERGSPPRGHDLLALFNELTTPTRKRLEAMWTDYVQHHPDRAAFKKAGVTIEPDLHRPLQRAGRGLN
jgi:HEPN domain-containing protein